MEAVIYKNFLPAFYILMSCILWHLKEVCLCHSNEKYMYNMSKIVTALLTYITFVLRPLSWWITKRSLESISCKTWWKMLFGLLSVLRCSPQSAAYIIITRLRTLLTLLLLTVFGHFVVLFRSMDITGLGREINSVIFLRNLLPCRMR